jgi:trimeric autotransporter adhesin
MFHPFFWIGKLLCKWRRRRTPFVRASRRCRLGVEILEDRTVPTIALTVTGITAHDKVYDSTTQATLDWSNAALNGVLGGADVSLNAHTYDATFASKDAGSAIGIAVIGPYLTGADAGDYALTPLTDLTADITPAPLTVSGISALGKVYDRTTAASLDTSDAAISGYYGGDTVSLDVGNYVANFASKNIGSGIAVSVTGLALSGPDAGDYTVTQRA